MNDDLEAAEAGLGQGNSSFHKLGKGIITFLRATLGFEPEIMREASERLADAEAQASTDHRRAQRNSHAYRSAIYPTGSEFALCHAQSQLMSAVVGVLNESLTESIKGFYKLRKAYITLDGILEAESRYVQGVSGVGHYGPGRRSVDSLRSNRSARSMKGMPGGFEGATRGKRTELSSIHPHDKQEASGHELDLAQEKDGASDVEEFYDADEAIDLPKPATYTGHVELDGVNGKLADLSVDTDTRDSEALLSPKMLPIREGMLDHDPDSDVFANPIDVFIHTGANLCFGMLLIMISMIPPAFGKLLFIIGFRGDRDRGLRMLWQASKFHNINGAMAGLILLGYYNTIVGFSDILPDSSSSSGDDAVEGYPKERCEALLADMRIRHPKSHLWLLEEARMNAANRRLSAAMALLNQSSKSPLKQVEALDMFEKSLDAMYMHDYTLCANSFVACVSLNNWSHALYYYIAGAAHVEQYRHYKTSSPKAAAIHAKKATELLREAPKHAGKKRFMARQLPFDIFVTRKLSKWEHRAHERNVELIDAIGVSPIEEMIYLWNGYKRMDPSQLDASLAALSWIESTSHNPTWTQESSDEHAILSVLRGVILRNLGQWDKATKALTKGVLSIDKAELKGSHKDDWTAPAAHYEMGVICWMRRRDTTGVNENDAKKDEREANWVKECEGWIEKAAKWEAYELDARIGVKIATAQDTLKKWRDGKGRG
ncbi:Mitochondrial outer membrane protein iml2 [Sticta canariensis]|nr:Mitochondrial outer membrane protein iml2 [Sticta canariensis]